MGRSSTGIWKINRCRKLDLKWMLKNRYIYKGGIATGSMEWKDGSAAGFRSVYTNDEAYFQINYSLTDFNGRKTFHDYRIELVTIPSNLGKGEVIYFQCPESGKMARVLYMAYRNNKYVHRDWYLENYGKRLYYDTQAESKSDYHNTMYFNLKHKTERWQKELYAKHRKLFYRGRPTKEYQKLIDMENKMAYHDNRRCAVLVSQLGGKYGLNL